MLFEFVSAVEKPPTPPLRSDSASVLSTVMNHEISLRSKILSRQDSRLSVKSLIESIENATKQAKTGQFCLLACHLYPCPCQPFIVSF